MEIQPSSDLVKEIGRFVQEYRQAREAIAVLEAEKHRVANRIEHLQTDLRNRLKTDGIDPELLVALLEERDIPF